MIETYILKREIGGKRIMNREYLCGLFSALMLLILNAPNNAFAGIKVLEESAKKLEFSGDLRYRFETDENNSKKAPDSETRTRERVRIRFGGGYLASENVEAGFRLATGSSSLHSPHQDLGNKSDGSLANADFGTDKAFVKYKRKGSWFWAGKNSLPYEQFTKTWFEGDYNPEGLALGYNASNGSLSLAKFVVQSNGNHAANDNAIFAGFNYDLKLADATALKFGAATLIVDESSRDDGDRTSTSTTTVTGGGTFDTTAVKVADIPGGDATYNNIELELKYGNFTIGGEYMLGNAAEDRRGGAGIAAKSDTNGVVVFAKVKLTKMFGARAYFHDLGYASIPLLGGWGADDFPQTSNYTGSRVQLDIDTGHGMKIDVRLYTMESKNRNLTSVEPGSDALNAKAAGEATKISRTQVNINVDF